MQTNGSQGQQNTQNNGQQKTTLSWSQPVNTAPQGKQPAQNTPARTTTTVAPVQKSGKKTWLIVAIVVVIALIIWGLSAMRKTSGEPTAVGTTATTTSSTDETAAAPATIASSTATAAPTETSAVPATSETTSTANGLTIPTPQNSGMQVAVSNVDATGPTWVVVYENHNGVPGNVLGAGLFTPDRKSGVVELLRGTLPGQTYFAGVSRDDGDHMYSMQNDPAIRDASGNPLMNTFQTR